MILMVFLKTLLGSDFTFSSFIGIVHDSFFEVSSFIKGADGENPIHQYLLSDCLILMLIMTFSTKERLDAPKAFALTQAV